MCPIAKYSKIYSVPTGTAENVSAHLPPSCTSVCASERNGNILPSKRTPSMAWHGASASKLLSVNMVPTCANPKPHQLRDMNKFVPTLFHVLEGHLLRSGAYVCKRGERWERYHCISLRLPRLQLQSVDPDANRQTLTSGYAPIRSSCPTSTMCARDRNMSMHPTSHTRPLPYSVGYLCAKRWR